MSETTDRHRPRLWLLLAKATDPASPYAAATLGWMAQESEVLFEAYFEDAHEGSLFSRSGGTVLGGNHYGSFTELVVRFDVVVFRLGATEVFDSSVRAFGLTDAASGGTALELTLRALEYAGLPVPDTALVGPADDPTRDEAVSPYLYPEIVHLRALGVPTSEFDGLTRTAVQSVVTFEASTPRETSARVATARGESSSGVAFGDPYAILALMPRLIRENRVALFGPAQGIPAESIRFSAYTEETSSAITDVADLALALGSRVVVGRQTTDGDLFALSRRGLAMQIVEPNRPLFPVLATQESPWMEHPAFDALEPSDDQLRQWADEGIVLTTLLWHSGESAHNEAMLNLVDCATSAGVHMGLGVHAERYTRLAQQWELIAIARESGGARGLIEPILYSGGMGILAEYECPPAALAEHCAASLDIIRSVAGETHVPKGYQAFCDTDLVTMAEGPAEIYAAIASAGLSYAVSSARPGRNRIVARDGDFVALNQSARSVAHASPFVRVTTAEELREDVSVVAPGWIVATLDSPVIALDPYIWSKGSRFLEIVEWLSDETGPRRNVLPSTVARYARLLHDEGKVPLG